MTLSSLPSFNNGIGVSDSVCLCLQRQSLTCRFENLFLLFFVVVFHFVFHIVVPKLGPVQQFISLTTLYYLFFLPPPPFLLLYQKLPAISRFKYCFLLASPTVKAQMVTDLIQDHTVCSLCSLFSSLLNAHPEPGDILCVHHSFLAYIYIYIQAYTVCSTIQASAH